MTHFPVVRTAILCLALALPFSIPALAQSAPQTQGPKPDAWEFHATAYLWGTGLSGDVGVGKLAVTGIEASFDDLLSVLDLGLMGTFAGRKGRNGFLVDAFYVKLSHTTPARNELFGDSETELVEQLYTFLGSYRLEESKSAAIDLYYGARYASLDTDLELTGGIASGRQASHAQSWWDGIVGLGSRWKLGKHWGALAYGDFGGGGSSFTWEVVGGVSYSFNQLVSIDFGYRYLSIDYDTDEFLYNTDMAGPYLGAGFRF